MGISCQRVTAAASQVVQLSEQLAEADGTSFETRGDVEELVEQMRVHAAGASVALTQQITTIQQEAVRAAAVSSSKRGWVHR